MVTWSPQFSAKFGHPLFSQIGRKSTRHSKALYVVERELDAHSKNTGHAASLGTCAKDRIAGHKFHFDRASHQTLPKIRRQIGALLCRSRSASH